MQQPLWVPGTSSIQASQLNAFMALVNQRYQTQISNYADLYAWSIENNQEFWELVWEFSGLVASDQGSQVLENPERMPGARWFPEARLNFAENLLRFRDDRQAVVSLREDGQRTSLTHAELYDQVAQIALALEKMGVGPGDRVAGFVPNCHYALIAMLAAASLGAIWSSCSPDFGF
ncbi:AMP-binding protein, partial [Marinospirillum sp.]|uniref:AMP-binding protein n=1 Tax=Marinospirillum sp. TaxID=2183934 RepID=UPI002870A7B9